MRSRPPGSREGITDAETHAFFTRLMDEAGAMRWGRITDEMMESYWSAVVRGDEAAPPFMREWAVKPETRPKYVVWSTRTGFPWTNRHLIGGDLRTGVQQLEDATPVGVLLGSGTLAAELDRLDLIDAYLLRVHPRIAGHGPTLYQGGLPETARAHLREAALQRRGGHARPARGLTGSRAGSRSPLSLHHADQPDPHRERLRAIVEISGSWWPSRARAPTRRGWRAPPAPGCSRRAVGARAGGPR